MFSWHGKPPTGVVLPVQLYGGAALPAYVTSPLDSLREAGKHERADALERSLAADHAPLDDPDHEASSGEANPKLL
jgi:hypothetical protein